jgi:hypothetical protein
LLVFCAGDRLVLTIRTRMLSPTSSRRFAVMVELRLVAPNFNVERPAELHAATLPAFINDSGGAENVCGGDRAEGKRQRGPHLLPSLPSLSRRIDFQTANDNSDPDQKLEKHSMRMRSGGCGFPPPPSIRICWCTFQDC